MIRECKINEDGNINIRMDEEWLRSIDKWDTYWPWT